MEHVAFSPDGQLVIASDDTSGQTLFWRMQGMDAPYLLGLYVTVDCVSCLHWQDETSLLLADPGAGNGRPFVYHLRLEGTCWRQKEEEGRILP